MKLTYLADLNPRFPAKGEKKYFVYYNTPEHSRVIVRQFDTLQSAQRSADRRNFNRAKMRKFGS